MRIRISIYPEEKMYITIKVEVNTEMSSGECHKVQKLDQSYY